MDSDREYSTDFALASGLVESQVQLIKSQHTALTVIDRLGMAPIEVSTEKSLISRLRTKLGVESPDQSEETLALRAAVDKLQSSLKVRRLSQTFVVEVTYRSRNPLMAKKISQAFAQAYIEDLLESSKRSAKLASNWLRDRLEDLRQQSRAADRAMQQFRSGGEGADLVALNDLESRSQVARVAYENVLKRFTDIEQKQSFPVAAARIASDASMPEPVGPGSTVLTLIAAAVAVLIGVGLSAWSDQRRHALKKMMST